MHVETLKLLTALHMQMRQCYFIHHLLVTSYTH